MNSLLIVPGHDTDALAAAASTQADALIIDLAYSGSIPSRAVYECVHRAIVSMRQRLKVFVCVNTLNSELLDEDLAAVMPANPEGILLPDAIGNVDVEHLAAKLRVLEAQLDFEDGKTRIIPLISNSSGVLAAAGMCSHRRIAAIGWLPFHPTQEIDVSALIDSNGDFHDVPRLTRTLALLAASHIGVPAIDAPYPPDVAHFYRNTTLAWQDGFAAKMARTEAQVSTINDIFRSIR